jgi:two-component system, OmpR family, copper resistance phosphate regulon response regulator CusR
MRILIVEDDEALARFIRQGLEGEHYSVDVCPDGERARTAAIECEYDVVVLDLNLPKLDGVSVLRQLRVKKPTLPVLVLTQRTKVEDRVQCLDTGADDYLPKPFSFSELAARIRALVRRSHLPSESVLQVADLKLDRVQRIVERAGKKIDLTAKEFCLLEYLMRNAGRDMTRSMIIEHVWNLSFDTTTNVVDVYINYLDQSVRQTVDQINQLSQQIANLNAQISNLENVGRSAGTFVDQRTQLIDQLSSLIDVSVIPTNNTLTLTTATGMALVAGQDSFQISTHPDGSGALHIYSQGNDITASIVSGQLGGILQARDQSIPRIQDQLDTLAAGLANAVNQVQTSGYDLNGNLATNTNLFTSPATVAGAASSLSVAITDPARIAASSDGTSGSNGNAEAMYALRNQAVINGKGGTGCVQPRPAATQGSALFHLRRVPGRRSREHDALPAGLCGVRPGHQLHQSHDGSRDQYEEFLENYASQSQSDSRSALRA